MKVTAQVTWQMADPVAATTRDADHLQTIYAATQQALRTAVAARQFDQLASQRAAIAGELREALATEVAAIGLQVHGAALKDVMLGAELRKALAAVALARQDGLAALEKARGEQATLRVLANAARLLAEQPALAQLKGLLILAEGLRAGATVVVNAGEAGLVPPRPGR